MRRALGLASAALVALIGVLWLSGALEGLADALRATQRRAQEALAAAIRALRSGEAGALAGFWLVCLAYGVLHAAGPGHGKLIIAGYGVARRVPVLRLVGLALASSLAQAAVAVGLVYAVLVVIGGGRLAVEGAAERWMTPVGHAMIAGLGLWLVWRGVRGLRRGAGTDEHGHAHGHVHGPDCDHAHGPSLDQISAVSSWRDAMALIVGIAVRPCSGALFVLVLTWQLGIALAGIIGAFVMGVGTALVTMAVAVIAVWAREGAFQGLGTGRVARAVPFVELSIGGLIAAAALGLLWQGV